MFLVDLLPEGVPAATANARGNHPRLRRETEKG
jgi:hypothetical protein